MSERLCGLGSCDLSHAAHDLCSGHLYRLNVWGDPREDIPLGKGHSHRLETNEVDRSRLNLIVELRRTRRRLTETLNMAVRRAVASKTPRQEIAKALGIKADTLAQRIKRGYYA